jgi:CubicO group peptidase (beta-lactamase class C family)
MVDTAFHVPQDKRQRIMGMYGTRFLHTPIPPKEPPRQELKPLPVDDEHPFDRPGTFERGGHGLFSTAEDYGRFADMLVSGRAVDGRPILAGPTLDLFAANRLSDRHLPMVINRVPIPGYGFGMGVRVRTDPGRTYTPGAVGEFGWSGAATTNFWVDPKENITGVFMTQYQGPSGTVEPVTDEFRTLAYATLV